MNFDLAFYSTRQKRVAQRFKQVDGVLCRQCIRCDKWKVAGEENYAFQKCAFDGFCSRCRECEKEIKRERRARDPELDNRYYEKNKEILLAKQSERRNKNRDEINKKQNESYYLNKDKRLADCKRYYQKNIDRIKVRTQIYQAKNKEKIAARSLEYRKSNKEKSNRYFSDRYKNDPIYRLKQGQRNRIGKLLKESNTIKTVKTPELLGCTVAELKVYLERLFLPGMTWENHGRWKVGQPMTWHVDHIRPCAIFDLTDPEQQKTCFHYTNLQPLWAIDNLMKSASLPV